MLSLGWIGALLAGATVAVWLYSGRAAEVQEATAADGAVPPPVCWRGLFKEAFWPFC
jgi:uncharacterized membrane protein